MDKKENDFSKKIGAKADRKLKAQQENQNTVWFGLGMIGTIGWSIVLPTLLGIAIGTWLDGKLKDSYSWTLMLLFIGLMIGCLNAWYWIKKEDNAIHKRKD